MYRNFVLAVALTLGPAAAKAEVFNTPTVLDGTCLPSSHIAEGSQTEDLTKRQSRFFCNSVVIINPNNDASRVLFTFVEKQSETNPQLGYAGHFTERDMVRVERVYLRSGVAQTVDDGACKIFRKGGQISGISCGAKLDQGDRRTVPIVGFDVREAKAAATENAGDRYPPYRRSGVATCTCPGTSIEFFLDGDGHAQVTNVQSNYAGFTSASRVKRWSASVVEKGGQKLLVLDNGRKSRIMTDTSTQKAMGFLADGGVSDMLCQVLVKPD
jgi:hypothetical protein